MSMEYMSDRTPTNGGRPAANRARSTSARPAGARPAGSRPAGSRPPGSRPAPGGSGGRRPPNRRQPPRRRKPQSRFYIFIALAVVVIVALAILIAHLAGGGSPSDPTATSTAPVETTAVTTETTASTADPGNTDAAVSTDGTSAEPTSATSHADALRAMLGSEDASDVTALSEDEMTQITDLSVTQGLPSEWMNILLLGSDERTLSESARTDSMIICSINTTTGEVKLTSIMRDLAVYLDEIDPEYAGTYRINAANYFGGEELAMRVVNECFGMNIERYVHVNFYGFQQVAELLGGIEMDITEEEMNLINELIVQQASLAYHNNIDESGLQNEFLTTYGEDTHLDGRQTLAYARIRKLDGGDYARAERQRNVLIALMNKLRGSSLTDLVSLGITIMPHLRTNLTLDEIAGVAYTVLNSDLSTVEQMRLPINDSYVEETRDEQSMLYDCDWTANATELYNFIYE